MVDIWSKRKLVTKGGVTIYFSDFCKIIYPAFTKNISSQSEFVDLLFRSVNNTEFLKGLVAKDTEKLLFSNSDKKHFISNTIRVGTPKPFPFDEARKFFVTYLRKEKEYELFKSFKIDSSYIHDWDTFIITLAEMLEQFCSIEENSITDDVADIYKRKVTEALKNTDILEMELLSAQNETCPICGKPLVSRKRNGTIEKNYSLIYIYPKQETIFSSTYKVLRKPEDNLESPLNKILVCKADAKKYNGWIDENTYILLYDKRKKIQQTIDIKIDLDNVDYSSEIIDLLNFLVNLNNLKYENEKLSFDAKKIKDKIPNDLDTYQDVLSKVTKYYDVINNFLVAKDWISNIEAATNLTKYIRSISDALISKGLNEYEVIWGVAEEIAKRKDSINPIKYQKQAFIIASFFVQHCEVLSHETSK